MLERYAEAARDWKRTLEIHEGDQHDQLRIELGHTLARSGQAYEAAENAYAVATSEKADSVATYDAAMLLMLCAATVELDDPDSADGWATDGIELFERAREDGFFTEDAQRIDVLDQELPSESLRARDDYKALLARLRDG